MQSYHLFTVGISSEIYGAPCSWGLGSIPDMSTAIMTPGERFRTDFRQHSDAGEMYH